MRGFIILCLIAITCADKLGYYQPLAHSDSGFSFSSGASAVGAFYDSSATVSAPSTPNFSAPAELDKAFYSFSAPDGEFVDTAAAQRALGAVKQGLRVVFIKGPENKEFEDAALALAKQAAQQQTEIYVLNKQSDIGDLVNKFNTAGTNANGKPEVHFVKYRTPEDAANAQKAIQSQYDSLAGNSLTINGGVAPVINFASQPSAHTVTAQQPQSAYLPSSIFRRRL